MTATFGEFEILAPLAEGGMGAVLLARRRGALGFEKLFAIKTLRAPLDARADVRAMFLDEAKLVAGLAHPSIAQVVDFGEIDGRLYIAMEYVAGVPLTRWIGAGRTPLPPLVAAQMVAGVCRGLHAAHEHRAKDGRPLNVIHRDVSPQNVLFTYAGYVKILDFGVAKMRDRTAPPTLVGQIKGKVGYLAPEILAAAPFDRRVDVYAAALVLHELLTGLSLYAERHVNAIIRAIVSEDPPPPSSLRAGIPPALDAIVALGMAKDPALRYSSARDLADALDAVIAGVGGCSLEAFAEEALAEERERHQTRMLRLASGDPSAIARPAKPRKTEVDEGAPPEVKAPRPASTKRRRGRESAAIALVAAMLIGLSVLVAATLERARVKEERVVLPPAERAVPKPPSPETRGASPEVGSGPGRMYGGAQDERRETGPKIQRSEDLPGAARTVAPLRGRKPSPWARTRAPLGPAETVAPSPAPGFLTVGADPYAIVWIDGRSLGPTPIVDAPLRPGEHTLRCLEPDTDRVRLERKLDIESGEHKSLTVR